MNSKLFSLACLWPLIYGLIGINDAWNIGRNQIHEYLRNRTQTALSVNTNEESRLSKKRNLLPLSHNLKRASNVDEAENVREIPKFMLDVFRMFDQDHSLQPTSNIIRSFHNVANQTDRNTFASINDLCTRYPRTAACQRKYLILFNTSKIPAQEAITRAELRFRYISALSRSPSSGVNVDIKVEHIFCGQHEAGEMCESLCSSRQLIKRKSLTTAKEGWLTIDVTHLLRKSSGSKCLLRIEVDLFVKNRKNGMVEIDTTPMTPKEPLLVVFSDDPSKHNRFEKEYETRNLIAHEKELFEKEKNTGGIRAIRSKRSAKGRKMNIHMDGIKIGVRRRVDLDRGSKSRQKRSNHMGRCHREEMEINFSQLGYSYIHTPRKYQAYRCVGQCTFPVTNDATHHAVFHATMHFRDRVEQPPCCVPIKLGGISMLFYYEESDVVEYEYEYPEMTVQECGCR